MTSGRPSSVSPLQALALIHDGFDQLTARSALRSLALAGLAVAAPAALRPEADYYLLQGGILLAGALVLFLLRRRLTSRTVARAALGIAALTIGSASLLSGGSFSPAYHAYSVALVGAAWLVFTPRGALLATAVIVGLGAMLTIASTGGWVPGPWLVPTPASAWVTTTTASAVVALVQWLDVVRLRGSNAALAAELDRSEAAQQLAARNEQRYADVVSTAPGVVCEFEVRPDGARAFTFVSEGARRLFDRDPAEILANAQVLFAMVDGPKRAAVDAAIQQSRETLAPLELEGAIRTPGGQVKSVRAHALASRRPDGTVRWHGFITDMSERIKAEHALRESQQALKQSLSMIRGAFESTVDGLVVVDTEGRIRASNQKFMALWRVPEVLARTHDADQLRAHVMRQFDDAEAYRARVAEILAHPEAVSFDALALADGRHYERYSQPQVVDGAVVGRVWSFRDVTARVTDERRRAELEQGLQRAHTLEALGTLAGGIAHDFNNLLTIILANAEQAAAARDPGQQTASLAAITTAAERASALVSDIRQFSQPPTTERAVVTVAGTIGHALQLLRATLPKNITMETRLDPKVTMFTSATQVQQVVTNLVLNAGQALADAPGTIAVVLEEVGAADVPETTPRPLATRYARLTVADTGPGIAAETMPRIFDPFFTTRDDGAGSGLGLAMVNAIVRRHHGVVTVDSVQGAGTTFQVYWPALPPAGTTATAAAPVAAGDAGATTGRGRHILVVDDEPGIVKVIANGLRRLGYEVTATTDPREALAIFEAGPLRVDAVLSDLSMPHLSGAVLGRRMLDLRPDTPIVLFTGYSAELSPEQARAAGFRAVLNKPMSLSVLAESLHRILPAPVAAPGGPAADA